MKSHDHFVEGGGHRYGGRPMTRLFAILSLVGLFCLITGLLLLYALCKTGHSLSLFSGSLWLCILLIVPEPVFIFLAIRFALTEKPREYPTKDYDPRNLY